MDVSRIEAYNPNKINWRNLTAKEILKYEKQGVQVPDVYFQWAQEFLGNIKKYDNDDVTYEQAKSITRYDDSKQNDNLATSNLSDVEKDNQEKSEVAEVENLEKANNVNNANEEPALKTQTAQEKLNEMKANGYSSYKIAETFRDISVENKTKSETAVSVSESASSSSDNEIQILEGNMADLMSQINDIKSQIQNLKSKKDETVALKIVRLNNEIKKLGESGQMDLLSYRNDFDQFDLIINNQSEIGNESKDYGGTTINVAKKVFDTPTFYMRKSTHKAGDEAIKAGDSANDSSNSANQINSKNIKDANSYVGKIMVETGVGEAHNDNQKSEQDQDPITGKEKEADKDVKTAQNDGTDTTDKLHISIDELVKRKVRRGEYAKDA